MDSDENEWQGRSALIEALTSIFIDPETNLPFRCQYDNESLTFFRNILLLSLASIQSRRGQTPLVVIKHLLHFYDNIDTGPVQDTNTKFELDGSHYKSVLLYCLCKIKFYPNMKNWNRILKRILEMSVFDLDTDQAAAWTLFRLSKTSSPSLPGGGCLSANAINCIAEMESQELIIGATEGNLDLSKYKNSLCIREYFQEYCNVAKNITPPLVRAAALEGYIRVLWCKQIIANHKKDWGANYASTAINAVCDVISFDDNQYVRHSAALSLLFTVQYRPPRVAASSLSFGEHLSCLDLGDPHGYTSIYSAGKLFKSHKEVMTISSKSPEFQLSLKRLWGFLSTDLCDQCVRGVLLTVWQYCYGGASPLSVEAPGWNIEDDSGIPSELLAECRLHHTVNTFEMSNKFEKALLLPYIDSPF